jgi:hypothetical protein
MPKIYDDMINQFSDGLNETLDLSCRIEKVNNRLSQIICSLGIKNSENNTGYNYGS